MKSYGLKQESKHIIYFDANNLYCCVMSKLFPTSGFKCIDPKQFDSNKYTNNSSKGCVLKVEIHNDYPLAPHKIETKRGMLSKYLLKITDLFNIPIENVKKLVPNFFDGEKYVIHYKNLKIYLRIGF